jgi:hypothetical protein
VDAEEPNDRLLAEQRREQQISRIGNITVANGHLNPAMSNDPWE